ncbi:MAG: protein kinase [Magnetococcales bacterium]|nr:protein kinase [Magnetococcales bacterium]
MHLPIKYQLHEYQIERVIGQGGFGITYLVRDTNLDQRLAIKEFFPRSIVTRQDNARVLVQTDAQDKSSSWGVKRFLKDVFSGSSLNGQVRDQVAVNLDPTDEKMFRWGMNRFLLEAKTLAKFNHANIVKVKRFFKANGTAYMVMDYEEGETLDVFLKKQLHALSKKELMSEKDVFIFIRHLCDGLMHVHKEGVIHRDIKPGNILIRPNGVPVLLDFGAARQSMMTQGKKLTSMGTPAYAPPEQLAPDGEQGPWSDIFSLGSVLYLIVTGKRSINPQERNRAIVENRPDPLPSAVSLAKGNFSLRLLEAIDWSLKLDRSQRPQDLEAWLTKLRMNVGAPTPGGNKIQPEIRSFSEKIRCELTKGRFCWVLSLLSMFLGAAMFGTGERIFYHGSVSTAVNSVPGSSTAGTTPTSAVNSVPGSLPAGTMPTSTVNSVPGSLPASTTPTSAVNSVPGSLPSGTTPTSASMPGESSTLNGVVGKTEKPERQHRLTIKTQPQGAVVRILNIKQKYEPGIFLPPDSYQVSVAKEGYQTRTVSVQLQNADLEITINLDGLTKK